MDCLAEFWAALQSLASPVFNFSAAMTGLEGLRIVVRSKGTKTVFNL